VRPPLTPEDLEKYTLQWSVGFADLVFARRRRGTEEQVEVHVSRRDMAAIIALAFEHGVDVGSKL
jgi:hypothetical protein